MLKTFKKLFGDGYISYGDDGKTYRTTKDVIGDGYTTYGSDGSTYKTHKNLLNGGCNTSKITSGEIVGEAGSGIACAAVAIIILQICANTLTIMSYGCIVGLLLAPRLSHLCVYARVSRVWCSGVLFCLAAFYLIASVQKDVEAVSGTKRGGEGLITLVVLFIILILGILFAIYGLGESEIGFFAFFILMISLAWSYFNVFASIPYTQQMQRCAIGALIIIALVDQIILFVRKYN